MGLYKRGIGQLLLQEIQRCRCSLFTTWQVIDIFAIPPLRHSYGSRKPCNDIFLLFQTVQWRTAPSWNPCEGRVIKLIHVVIGEQGGASHESTITCWRMGNSDDYMGIDVTPIQFAVSLSALQRTFCLHLTNKFLIGNGSNVMIAFGFFFSFCGKQSKWPYHAHMDWWCWVDTCDLNHQPTHLNLSILIVFRDVAK